MSILPDHSLGFFNLWLLMGLYALPIILTILFRKHIFKATSSCFSSSRSSREYNLFIVSKFLMLIYFLYSIVVPIQLDTFLAVLGFVIYIVGFIFYSAAWVTIARSGSGTVFTQGPFRFSRHPIYVSSAVQFFGAGIVSQSWFFLSISILVGISHMRNAVIEEQICLEIFGEEYSRYMFKTPRWIGCPVQNAADTNDIL
jgi:protein-S-isoprenylcysteine O-methyltransferase Ste14